MASDRNLLATYIILAKAIAATKPYDARGAFILLHSITAGLGSDVPKMIDVAAHIHIVASMGDVDAVKEDARRAMARLVEILEQRLASETRA